MNDSTASPEAAHSAKPERTLVIDSVSRACSVALIENGEVVAADYREVGRGHAERLIPMVAALPGEGKADRIAVNCGPGSFTGVRIGLSAARALAFAWQAELVGYDSLAIVAAAALDRIDRAGAIAVILHGGHGEFLAATFDAEGQAMQDTVSVTPDKLTPFLDMPYIAGDAVEAEPVARSGRELIRQYPDARAFGLLGAQALRPAVALYAREPDARPASAAIPAMARSK